MAAAASWWIHRLPNRYRADALLLLMPQRVPETFVRSTVTTRVDNRLQSITQQVLSRTQLQQVIRDFDTGTPDERQTVVMQDIVDAMLYARHRDQAVKGDGFRLSFIADSPEVAMRIADRLASLFIGQTSLDRGDTCSRHRPVLRGAARGCPPEAGRQRNEAGGLPSPPQWRAPPAARRERAEPAQHRNADAGAGRFSEPRSRSTTGARGDWRFATEILTNGPQVARLIYCACERT